MTMTTARPTGTDPARMALVTGGTGGIGRAVALALAAGGDRVLFVGRDARRGAGGPRAAAPAPPRP